MRKIFIIFCCGVLLLTAGCGKQNESPPMESAVGTESEIIEAEVNPTPTESTVEKTEPMVSETTPAEEKEVVNELTTPTESEHTIPQKTETTVTETKSSTETDSSVAETKMHTETTSPTVDTDITESESVEETNCNQPYVYTAEIENLVVQYINAYRVEQGNAPAITLPGLTEVARYRAK